jgi:hypothetical protein
MGASVAIDSGRVCSIRNASTAEAAGDAEAVARYRAGHGMFKTVADLENAVQSVTGPGNDVTDVAARAAAIAAKRDRLEF